MSLIKTYGMPIFKEQRGFKYPQFWEYYKVHDRMYWNAEEYSLSQDIQDFAKASKEEKDFITKVMQLFTQNEVAVGHGYAVMLRIFKPTEVLAWLSSANAREYTHIENYSLFTETIGLGDAIYTDFLEIPIMSTKIEYLEKAKVQKYEDYKDKGLSDAQLDIEFRKAVARMLAVYAGGTELVSLYAQFAMLLNYQFSNKYPGLCTLVDWSIRDECYHGMVNAELFRVFISENMDIWTDSLKFDIYEAFREIVDYEHHLIDYLNPPHMPNESLKRYVEYCADNALKELGMKDNWGTTKNPLPYMDDVVSVIKTDFFSGAVTEYSKQIQGSWEDIDYERWK